MSSIRFQPKHRTGELHQGQKVAAGLFVARRDGTEAFEAVEETLDEVASRVDFSVQLEQPTLPATVRADDRTHPDGSDGVDDLVRVVARIGEEVLAARVFEEVSGDSALVPLTLCQLDVQRTSFRRHNGVELR